MSVLKARRTESKAEYINTANNLYAAAEDKVNFDIADIFQRRKDNEQVHCT